MRHADFLMPSWEKYVVLGKKPREIPFSARDFFTTFVLEQIGKVVL